MNEKNLTFITCRKTNIYISSMWFRHTSKPRQCHYISPSLNISTPSYHLSALWPIDIHIMMFFVIIKSSNKEIDDKLGIRMD